MPQNDSCALWCLKNMSEIARWCSGWVRMFTFLAGLVEKQGHGVVARRFKHLHHTDSETVVALVPWLLYARRRGGISCSALPAGGEKWGLGTECECVCVCVGGHVNNRGNEFAYAGCTYILFNSLYFCNQPGFMAHTFAFLTFERECTLLLAISPNGGSYMWSVSLLLYISSSFLAMKWFYMV